MTGSCIAYSHGHVQLSMHLLWAEPAEVSHFLHVLKCYFQILTFKMSHKVIKHVPCPCIMYSCINRNRYQRTLSKHLAISRLRTHLEFNGYFSLQGFDNFSSYLFRGFRETANSCSAPSRTQKVRSCWCRYRKRGHRRAEGDGGLR